MRLQSKGLGRKELVMDFREYEAVRVGDEVVIQGTIREPVRWDFSIRVCEDDLAGLVRIAGRRSTIGLLLRALFKRNKKHHWSGDPAEHVAEARTAGKAITARVKEKKAEQRAADKAEKEAAKAASAQQLHAVDDGTSPAESDSDDPASDRLEAAG